MADGDELAYVEEHIKGLRTLITTSARLVSWIGDDAKFIVANLR
jgi:hypothetical protein